MNQNHDLERRMADYYVTEAPSHAPDWLLAQTLDTVEGTPQRRTGIGRPWRFPPMNSLAKLAVGAVAIVSVTTIGLMVLRPPTTDPTAPGAPALSSSPTSSPERSSSPLAQEPPPMTERFDSTLNGISMAYPAGWQTRRASGPWTDGLLRFDTAGVDIIFDPTRGEDLYFAVASEALRGRPDREWRTSIEYVCDGTDGGAGYTMPDLAFDLTAIYSCPRALFGATDTRVYAIVLYPGDEGVADTYSDDWFRSVLATVRLLAEEGASGVHADSSPRAPMSPSPAALSYSLGAFPVFPAGPLPDRTEVALQAVVDAAVEQGAFEGVSASVISADRGSWSGGAGSWDGAPVSPDSRYPTHSAAKTIVAAEIFRLAEGGSLALDDLASSHLPPDLSFYDANGATIRQVLGMRSGIPDWNEDSELLYPAEQAATAVEVFERLPVSQVPPGDELHYASTNYVLLGTIIEHVTGRPMAEVLRSDVLAHAGLDGLVYTVGDALGADGWGVETTSASLARWGWTLYGGSVLSDASLREMTDFGGEWYGRGSSDFSGDMGTAAVGHGGVSSPTTCCSMIALVALPEEGMVIAVQARTPGTSLSGDSLEDVAQLTRSLRRAAVG